MAEPDYAEHPLAALEQAFVDEYLRSRGYTREALTRLPRRAAEQLLAEAEADASLLLAQIESRSHYMSEMDKQRFK